MPAPCGPNWASREELLTRNPVERLELPSLARVRMPTATVDLTRLLLGTSKLEGYPLRDRAIILTFFDTGVRVQELLDLDTTVLTTSADERAA